MFSPLSHLDGKNILSIFGGDKGGAILNLFIMILLQLNTHRSFGLGFKYKARHLSNYIIRELTVDLLLFSISLVYTKINA